MGTLQDIGIEEDLYDETLAIFFKSEELKDNFLIKRGWTQETNGWVSPLMPYITDVLGHPFPRYSTNRSEALNIEVKNYAQEVGVEIRYYNPNNHEYYTLDTLIDAVVKGKL